MSTTIKLFFKTLIFIGLISCQKNDKLIPIDEYKSEIEDLKTKKDVIDYWKTLIDFDQNIVLNAKTIKEYDSLSLVTLMKSALLYEIKGDSIFNSYNNPNNEILFIHNHIPQSNLDFWPILMKQKEISGKLLMYPAYQLEGISSSFYNYSVFGQDSIYDNLISKLNSKSYGKVSDALINTYLEQKRINRLTVAKHIGKWKELRYKGQTDTRGLGNFELIKMSDNNYYFRIKNERLKLLEVIDKNEKTFTFKTKNEPFNWYYKLSSNGDLSLNNENDTILLKYTKA